MQYERRHHFRIPQSVRVTEFHDDTPITSHLVNIGENGIYTVKPRGTEMARHGQIKLSLPLTGIADPLVAKGEIMYETPLTNGIGTGIRFTRISDLHRAILDHVLEVGRRHIVSEMLTGIAWKKNLKHYPTPLAAPPPPAANQTIPLIDLRAHQLR